METNVIYHYYMSIEEQKKIIEENCPLEKRLHSKRFLRHSFFKKIKTEIQAYLLGFYAADGSINEKRKTFRIGIKETDKEIIDLYRKWISPNAYERIRKAHYTTGRNKQVIYANDAVFFDIASTELCSDLIQQGYGYNKSYLELHLPAISNDLIPHFIRGYFDGDGSIIGWVNKEIKKNLRFRYKFTICSKTKSLLLDI